MSNDVDHAKQIADAATTPGGLAALASGLAAIFAAFLKYCRRRPVTNRSLRDEMIAGFEERKRDTAELRKDIGVIREHVARIDGKLEERDRAERLRLWEDGK